MITMRKLRSLPSSTRHRKIARILEAWVRDAAIPDSAYVRDLLALIEDDEGLPEAVRAAATHAVATTADAPSVSDRAEAGDREAAGGAGGVTGVRAIDRLRHLLLRHLGMEPADWDLLPPAGVPASARPGSEPRSGEPHVGLSHVGLYLEAIRAPFNVGSILRTAAAFGVRVIGVSDDVPPAEHPRVRRSAMGAVECVTLVRGALDVVAARIGGPVIALELGGTPIESFAFPERGVLVLGSEELGISPKTLKRADHRVSIPMPGPKASLNVGVACGIALAAWRVAIR
ncbi:MAG: TrmH family RNA methyltransferase [Spirochaetales bacterium]